jgi:hypothetical protein
MYSVANNCLITLRFFASSLRNSAVKKGLTAENRKGFTQRAAKLKLVNQSFNSINYT